MDTVSQAQRHKNMAAIRSKNTKPEMIVRRFLCSRGFRYRLYHKRLPGHPDIVMRKYRTCIFVNGCFWHGHEGCSAFRMPKTNTEFWEKKITRNQCRDKQDLVALAALGWHCITIWECQLKPQVRLSTLTSLEYTLNAIYLQDHSVAYPVLEEETTLERAAEQETKGYPEQNK